MVKGRHGENATPGIRPGDLFFTTSGSIFSQAVRFRTWARYSHVQLITLCAEVDGERMIDVVSADVDAVKCRAVREGEWSDYAILSCPEMTIRERSDVVKFCFSKIGAGYDFLGLADFLFNADLQAEDRFFCSELVYLAYEAAGRPLLKRIDHAFVSPMHLYISPILAVIESSGGEKEE
jgi:uncharacterized protein YycO